MIPENPQALLEELAGALVMVADALLSPVAQYPSDHFDVDECMVPEDEARLEELLLSSYGIDAAIMADELYYAMAQMHKYRWLSKNPLAIDDLLFCRGVIRDSAGWIVRTIGEVLDYAENA